MIDLWLASVPVYLDAFSYTCKSASSFPSCLYSHNELCRVEQNRQHTRAERKKSQFLARSPLSRTHSFHRSFRFFFHLPSPSLFFDSLSANIHSSFLLKIFFNIPFVVCLVLSSSNFASFHHSSTSLMRCVSSSLILSSSFSFLWPIPWSLFHIILSLFALSPLSLSVRQSHSRQSLFSSFNVTS